MSDQDYQRYLKYKKKYLTLKQQQRGGQNAVESIPKLNNQLVKNNNWQSQAQEFVQKTQNAINDVIQPAVQKGNEFSQDVNNYINNLSNKAKSAFQIGGHEIYIPYFIELEQRLNPIQIIPLTSNQQQMYNQVLSFVITARANPSWDAINNARMNLDNMYMQLNMNLHPWAMRLPMYAVPATMLTGGKD